MSETLYLKSWEPLSEADKSAPQVVRHKYDRRFYPSISTYSKSKGMWVVDGTNVREKYIDSYEFLCLTPVEQK